MESSRIEATGFGHSLRNPAFRNLFASSTTSALGSALSLVSVSWIVYHYTGSALDIAYLGLTGIVPGVVLGLFAGVLADRYNRRSLMITADLTRMAGMGLLTVVLFASGFSFALILATMILVNCFSALFTPASQAIVPRIVARTSLEDANGLLQSSLGVAWSAGSAAGGILVVLLGAVWGLGINALTYALSAVFLFQIASGLGRPLQDPSKSSAPFRKDLSEGMGYVLKHRPIFEVGFGYMPINFLSSLVTPFLVVYAATRFGGNAAVYGALAAALAAGAAVGSLVGGRIAVRRFAGLSMGASILIESGGYGLVAVSPSVALALLGALSAGLAIGFANTVYYATIQAIVPGEFLGRVLSIGDFGSFVAIPAGLVAGGLLIAHYGVETSFLAATVGIFLSGLVLLSLPGFRSFGRTPEPHGQPPPLA
ncbi:MAG: MFS transporter [Thermoplasmata archaeon]|nr:MFS transporter [Thermoplasmata archaeon]